MAKDALIEEAKALLRKNGYVVVPRDRHKVLTVCQSIDWMFWDHLQSCDAKAALTGEPRGNSELGRFTEHVDYGAARQFGCELKDMGAIVKTDDGWDKLVTRRMWRYELGVIMPRAADDNR